MASRVEAAGLTSGDADASPDDVQADASLDAGRRNPLSPSRPPSAGSEPATDEVPVYRRALPAHVPACPVCHSPARVEGRRVVRLLATRGATAFLACAGPGGCGHRFKGCVDDPTS